MKFELTDLTLEDLNKKNIMRGVLRKPCFVCSDDTVYIDFCSEARICSEECLDEHNAMLNKACNEDIVE